MRGQDGIAYPPPSERSAPHARRMSRMSQPPWPFPTAVAGIHPFEEAVSMHNWLAVAAVVLLAVPALAQQAAESQAETNPLLSEWKTPFGVPPFDQIKTEHFLPAFEEAHRAPRPRGRGDRDERRSRRRFENTVEALDAVRRAARQGRRGLLQPALRRTRATRCRRSPSRWRPWRPKHRDDILPRPEKLLRAGQGGLGRARGARARRRAAAAARGDLQGLRARRRAACRGRPEARCARSTASSPASRVELRRQRPRRRPTPSSW